MCGDFNIQPYSKMYNFILGDQSEYIFNETTSSEKTPTESTKTSTFSNNNSNRKHVIEFDYIITDEKKEDYRNNFIHCLPFASVYKHYTGEPRELEISTYNTCGASNPDYIFYGVANTIISEDIVFVNETSTLSLLGRLTLPSASKIAQNLGPMPNSITSSDHLLLLAHFQMK